MLALPQLTWKRFQAGCRVNQAGSLMDGVTYDHAFLKKIPGH
jgi:hypothetical protein